DELPGISVELELELPVFVDDQLGRRVEDTGGLILVGIVYVELSGSQVVRDGLRVVINFTEPEQAVGDEANLATCWSGNQANVTEVVANGSGDCNTADGLHLGQGIHQSLVLAFFEGFDENCSIVVCGKLGDGHLHVDNLTQLRAGTHRRCVNYLYISVIGGKSRYGRHQE